METKIISLEKWTFGDLIQNIRIEEKRPGQALDRLLKALKQLKDQSAPRKLIDENAATIRLLLQIMTRPEYLKRLKRYQTRGLSDLFNEVSELIRDRLFWESNIINNSLMELYQAMVKRLFTKF